MRIRLSSVSLVEAGARLAFDRGDAVGDQPAHARAAGGVERLLRQQPRAPREGADAAAVRLEVPALAALTEHLEVDQALLAIDDVGVRIDQARRDDLAAEIPDRVPRRLRALSAAGPTQATLPPAMPIAPSRTRPNGASPSIVATAAVGEQQVEHAIPHLSIAPRSQPGSVTMAVEAEDRHKDRTCDGRRRRRIIYRPRIGRRRRQGRWRVPRTALATLGAPGIVASRAVLRGGPCCTIPSLPACPARPIRRARRTCGRHCAAPGPSPARRAAARS